MEHGELPSDESEESEPKSILTRANGRQVERMCIYLDPEVSEELRVHCARRRKQISEEIENALRKYLKM